MSSKIKVDAVESNSATTSAITLDSNGTGVYKATSVETPNIKHASSSSNNIVLASDGSVKTNQVAHTANGASVFTLPQTDGSANHVLKTNGSGALSFGAVSNGNSLQVLEQFYSCCDGSVMPTNKGNITLANVTAEQEVTTTATDLTGSTITYEPPAGTVQVIYEFVFFTSYKDANAIGTLYLFLDGIQVTDSRRTFAAEDLQYTYGLKWGFNINSAGTVNATGQRADWNGGREIKLQVSEYGASNEVYAHLTRHTGTSGTGGFVRPCIGITAIGVPS